MVELDMTLADPATPSPTSDEAVRDGAVEVVACYLGAENFAFPLRSVREIIRMPDVAQVPMGPASLLGLANLRGTLLPVVSLHGLLFSSHPTLSEASRVVVLEHHGLLVGFVVDRMDRVVTIPTAKIEPVTALHLPLEAELLSGIIKESAGHAMIMLFDVERLLSSEFAAFTSTSRLTATHTGSAASGQTKKREEEREILRQLVSFQVADQEYAFPIELVQEIVRTPETIGHVPKSASQLLGLINLRHELLPLVSLRRLFNLPPEPLGEQSRICVISLDQEMGNMGRVGIVVDRVREVLRVPLRLVDLLPEIFSQEGKNREIEAVCRLQGGKRLVSILSAERMFAHEALQEVLAMQHGENAATTGSGKGSANKTIENIIQLVVFRLAEEEFGVTIASVQEIIRIPDELTHVPKTPAFIEGMVNLRGVLLPVVDLRTRLGLPRMSRNERQRIVVFTLNGTRTGFIVDSVSQVLKIPERLIETTPSFSVDQERIMKKVVNLEKEKRMILLLEVEQLLEEKELQLLTHGANP